LVYHSFEVCSLVARVSRALQPHGQGVKGKDEVRDPRGESTDLNAALTEEQDEFRNSVRRFLEERSPESEVRRLMETTDGYDPGVWSQMASQLGLQGLIIPDEFGGSGSSYVDLIVVFEEMGRALLCAPYFSSVALAANLVLASGDESAKRDYLPSIADGSSLATVALVEESGRWDAEGITLTATPMGPSWRLTGEKWYVLDGHVADLLLVGARTQAGVSVFAVEAGASGMTATPLPTMDQTRKQAHLRFESVPARLVGVDGGGWEPISKMLDFAAVAQAAEQVGGAQKVLDMSVDYANVRVQFGRPIGSFQAVKHKCADMLVEVESARSAAYHGAWTAVERPEDLPFAASLAKAYCSQAFFHCAAENIQIHGGIGFTWEHPAHLYFKRAKSSELLFGDPYYHRERLAQLVALA
jgi:alkylation response protein AidB-like acyl-CoA dehydrogenase